LKAEIITIGDEILIGQIVDTNSAWLGEQLTLLGFDVFRKTSIHDELNAILTTLSKAEQEADVVIMTGGLGPTKDDMTKPALCQYFNTELMMNHDVLKHVIQIFESRGREVLETNRLQAMVPANCEVLFNHNGTAPGMWFNKNGKIFISLPGVPYEMKSIIENEVLDKLKKSFKLPHIFHKTVLTQGIGESKLADIISDWENNLTREGLKLAYLPSPGIVRLRITAKGDNEQFLINQVNTKVEELLNIIPNLIFGFEKQTLEEVVGMLLVNNKLTISTAESCTGGYLAHLLTSISGSSNYYIGSTIAYSNQVKIGELLVNPKDIEVHGAVSEQVVKQMAVGALKKYDTDYAISTSGIAGPTGGTATKQVGTVWIGIASKNNVTAHQFVFGNNRERNIRMSALTALNLLRKEILKNIV
jgi:nicotinamide-nucleotide amidase